MTMKLVDAGATVALPTGKRASGEGELRRIGDIASEYGVTLRTLRFYEDKGLLHPLREGTTRLYTHRDEARLKLILLGRKVGFSLRDVKQMLDLYDPKGSNAKQLRVMLEKSEKQLARLNKQRQDIDDAIRELTASMTVARARLTERTPPVAVNGRLR